MSSGGLEIVNVELYGNTVSYTVTKEYKYFKCYITTMTSDDCSDVMLY